MSDRGIIMSASSVKALLTGRKTQTRRLIKGGVPEAPSLDIHPYHVAVHAEPYLDAYCGEPRTPENPRGMSPVWCWWTRDNRAGRDFRLGYQPGQRLWVKESLRRDPHTWVYEADGCTTPLATWEQSGRKTMTSVFMPKACSRLTLTITDVRVQRLWKVSEDDARAEGVRPVPGQPDPPGAHRVAYRDIWLDLHGLASWNSNPFVVALTFSVECRNIDSPPVPKREEAA